MSRVVTDLSGRVVAGEGSVTVKLRPGIGVQVNGEHVEGGPHALPSWLAYDLVRTQRADVWVEPTAQPVEGAPSGVEHRDPVVQPREGKRKR